jgi:hypothetical protein
MIFNFSVQVNRALMKKYLVMNQIMSDILTEKKKRMFNPLMRAMESYLLSCCETNKAS